MDTGSGPGRHRLTWDGGTLELAARRAGMRTVATLYRDGRQIAEKAGVGRVALPLPQPRPAQETGSGDAPKPPTVLAVALVPGRLIRASLLLPRAADPDAEDADRDEDGGKGDKGGGPRVEGRGGGAVPAETPEDLPEGLAAPVGFAKAERHRFQPPPGTFAGRLWAFERRHPRLWASRHVVAATAKAVAGLLGIAVFFGVLLDRIVEWIIRRMPDIDLPAVPLPKVDLPSIPWPDIPLPDLPDMALPGWLQAIMKTAKYWVPILIAIGVAVEEVRRRNRREARAERGAGPADRDPAGEPEPR